MSNKIFYLFFVYIFDILIYIITKTKFGERLNKNIHKIFSVLNFSVFIGIFFIGFYEINHLFIVFVPIIIGFYFILGYSFNFELSDEDIAMLVIMRPNGTVKMKRVFLEIVTFPVFYLIKSWKNES